MELLRSKLGQEVSVLRYKGLDDHVVVPEGKHIACVKYLHEFRSDLIQDHGGLTVLEKETAKISECVDGYLVYSTGTMKFRIKDGWQLRTELEHGFTTIRRESATKDKSIDTEALSAAIDENKWIFAKTMAHNPHWYALRRKWVAGVMDFDTAVLIIRTLGYTQIYGRRSFRCLNVGKHFYWTMGAPLPITILINRKAL